MTDMRINPNYSNQAALNNINSKKPSSVSKFSGILKNAVQSAGNTQKSKSLDDIFNEAAEKNNIPVRFRPKCGFMLRSTGHHAINAFYSKIHGSK
jgi:hypothetical protein